MKYEITFLENLYDLIENQLLIEKGKIVYIDKALFTCKVPSGNLTFNIFDLKRKGAIKITNYDTSVKSSD